MNIKYSESIITDDNSDEEFEILCDILHISYGSSFDFVENLGDGFSKQTHEMGFEEWINQNVNAQYNPVGNVYPSISGSLAYEFGNGFMIFSYSEPDIYM